MFTSSKLEFMLLLRALSTFMSFFFNDTATTEIYTLSLHDALPICVDLDQLAQDVARELTVGRRERVLRVGGCGQRGDQRSEEHTSELQSRLHLVCRLLLEKKKHEGG